LEKKVAPVFDSHFLRGSFFFSLGSAVTFENSSAQERAVMQLFFVRKPTALGAFHRLRAIAQKN
jgi:hypothetical protein